LHRYRGGAVWCGCRAASVGLESQYAQEAARPGTDSAADPPPGYFAAGFALFCFGFFGVLAFLSTDASGSLPGRNPSILRRSRPERGDDLGPDSLELVALVAVQ